MIEIAPALGVAAALVGIADTVPYVRDTMAGTTRPHRGTWLIWATLAVVVCLSQRADGASWSLLMAATQALLTGLIFLLSVRRGEGGVSTAERAMIAIAAAGVAAWVIADRPVVATAGVIAADLVGATMMIPKTWRDPNSETLVTYVLAGVSGALATAAVAAPDPALLLYPAYFALINAAIAAMIVQRTVALRVST